MLVWWLACLSGACREHKYTMSSHNMGKAWQLFEWLSHFGCPTHPSWIKCRWSYSFWSKVVLSSDFPNGFSTSADLFVEKMSHSEVPIYYTEFKGECWFVIQSPEAQSMGAYYVASPHSARLAVSSIKKCGSKWGLQSRPTEHLNYNLSELVKKRDFL